MDLKKELELKQTQLTVRRLEDFILTLEQDYEIKMLDLKIKMGDMEKELIEKQEKAEKDLEVNKNKLKQLLGEV
jgi:hypothetical protein